MSGGVDSSVAAAMLVEAGHDVVGVHMKLHDAEGGGPGHCCGLDDALDARNVADALSIPFYVLNLQTAFRRAVMDDLADTYLAGRTPNPCIQCNGVLKFNVLLKRALALGCTHLATGHYARIGDGPTLMRAVDLHKDQSYFLFPMSPRSHEHTLFPLGGLTKDEVRLQAERLGLVTADKPESQEICFIPDDDHARFIRSHRPEVDGSGDIVDEEGVVLGKHDGYFRFTIGQRRGLGISMGVPMYVVRIEADSRRVVLAPAERLRHAGLVMSRVNWFRHPGDGQAQVRIRHKGAVLGCRVSGSDPCEVRFDEPVMAVAPGQAAVIYQGDEVVGGGWIDAALEVA
jgi:tRNA-specific 2-thiouridylase